MFGLACKYFMGATVAGAKCHGTGKIQKDVNDFDVQSRMPIIQGIVYTSTVEPDTKPKYQFMTRNFLKHATIFFLPVAIHVF